jgi:predicted protein tyrosine phosphatase
MSFTRRAAEDHGGQAEEQAFFFLRDPGYLERLPHPDLRAVYTNDAARDPSAGMGKTSLLAHFIDTYRPERLDDKDAQAATPRDRAQRVKNLLFVCSANIDRSPTGEAIYSRDPRFRVKSAGTSAYARRRVSSELLDWADLILVMEDGHRELILRNFPRTDASKIHCLDVADDFRFMEAELAGRIRNQAENIFLEVFTHI